MTYQEFLDKVIAINTDKEIIEYAQAEKNAIIARNEKRRSTPTKAQLENEELKAKILEFLGNTKIAVSSEIAAALDLTTAKVSALCTQLKNDGKVKAVDVKQEKKGKVKGYFIEKAE